MSCPPAALFFLAAAPALAAPAAASDLPSPPELVEIEGARLPRLLGARPEEIAAAALEGAALRPVHVQIDERFRDRDGVLRHALDAGVEPAPDPDPRFDADDLLLLWLPDGGPRLPAAERPAFVEVEATAPDGEPRWFYLVRGPVAAPAPLVRYDAADDAVVGQGYRLGFARGGDAVIDRLALGAGTPDLLDRSKVRLSAALVVGGTVERSEADVVRRTTGLQVGPLRILRAEEARARVVWDFYSAPVRDYVVFTPRAFMLPATVWLPRAVRALVREVTLRITMDLNDSARGLRFTSSLAPGVEDVVDGAGAPAAFTAASAPLDWYLLHREEIGLLGWCVVEPEDYARKVALYYRDDAAHADPPESVPGELGHHGFLFRSAGLPPGGEVRITTYAAVVDRDAMRDPAAVRARFAARPVVTVRLDDGSVSGDSSPGASLPTQHPWAPVSGGEAHDPRAPRR